MNFTNAKCCKSAQKNPFRYHFSEQIFGNDLVTAIRGNTVFFAPLTENKKA